MDAVKFLQERKRMFLRGDLSLIYELEDGMELTVDPEVLVKNVEQWSAAHPLKTRQSELLKQYPTAKIDESGCLDVCPYSLSATHRNEYEGCAKHGVRCSECRKEFWSQEVN